MFRRRQEINFFRKYPWVRIVILVGVVVIFTVFAVVINLNDEKIELSKSTQENGQLEATEESGEKMEDKAKDEAGEPQGNSEKKPEEKTEGAEDGGLVREVEQIGAGQVIALTFDDGPSEFTSGLLDILKREQVPATFFVLGRNASAYPDLIRREIAEGHEVESHTMNHQNLAKLDEASVRAEVYGVEQVICAIENKTNCIKYVRPPYGEVSDTVRSVVSVPMIGWSIDTEDWRTRNPQMIQDRTLGVIRGNAVILMHDIYSTSVEGAERIIKELKAAGFTFVTIDELVQRSGRVLEAGGYYAYFGS
ncbi:polysaccharide deacetylase family protein [Candidatus Saccharibacteria bacterium]|nr:polysaccharide deacetylase family protein [Candidatus Saccharibacteria bacterium]